MPDLPRPVKKASQAMPSLRDAVPLIAQSSVDLVWLMDATGSMSPHLDLAKSRAHEALAVMPRKLRRLRVTCGFYRDHEDGVEAVHLYGGKESTEGRFVRPNEFKELHRFLNENGTPWGGGHSAPEALGAALHYVSKLPWEAEKRILLQVGDQPSHGICDSIELCPLRMTQTRMVEELRSAQVQAYMVLCGGDPYAERQYAEIAKATGGRFIRFRDLDKIEDMLVLLEAVLVHGAGLSVRELLEKKKAQGLLAAPSAATLLRALDEPV